MMMMMMNSRRMSLRHKRTRRSRARPLERLQWTRDVHLARVTRARTLRTCARVCACACARVFFFFFLRFDQWKKNWRKNQRERGDFRCEL